MSFINKLLNLFTNMKKSTKIILLVVVILIVVILTPLIWYNSSIKAISKDSSKVKVEIKIGSGTSTIANVLKSQGLIKSELAFKIFVKLNNVEGLQAGNYTLDKNMNLSKITEVLKTGKVLNSEVITFVEGKNMRYIAKTIASSTNNTEDDVFNLLNDSSYIDELIDKYWFLTDEIKNKDIYYPLEGYLFPDTYDFASKNVSVKDIFKVMLDKMDSVLTEYKSKIDSNKYNVHELLSLASIVELEGIHEKDRKNIASVLYNRIDANIALGSDVTTYYAYKVDMGERDLYASELYSYNPYNTRGPQMFGKLPVGPIACVSRTAIEAVLEPSSTDYLYFIADKNGDVYFSKTDAEHQNLVQELKDKGLWFEY